MRTVAIIPARGGSKGISRKNLLLLAGKPLVVWSVDAGLGASLVEATYVSTEDAEIAEVAALAGARIIKRPIELASDTAQNDAVMRHALGAIRAEGHEPETAVLLQPTSPLRRAEHVDGCIEIYHRVGAASAMSVCAVDYHPGKSIVITNGMVEPFTNDHDMEARRQDMVRAYRQNGAIYITGVADFLSYGQFYKRPCVAYEMERALSIDIDEPLDLELVELMMANAGGAK